MFLLNLIMLITGYIWWGAILLGGIVYLCIVVWQKIAYDGKTKHEQVTNSAVSEDVGLTLFEVHEGHDAHRAFHDHMFTEAKKLNRRDR